MTQQLYSIAYFSHANLNINNQAIDTEIEQILSVARQRNQAHQVTGALLYSDGFFIQVLEGQLQEVEDIFESIQCDTRHRNIAVLHYNKIDQRSFADWSMALVGIQTHLDSGLKKLLVKPEDITATPVGHELIEALVVLLGKYQDTQEKPSVD